MEYRRGKMEEIKTEPVDFVREFQEYLTQQTQHVNMISGSVCGEKESGEQFQTGRNGVMQIKLSIHLINNR